MKSRHNYLYSTEIQTPSSVIWEEDNFFSSKLVVSNINNQDHLRNIMKVRLATDPRWPDQSSSVDNYSDLYCLYYDNEPIGCVGATRLINGPLFMQEFCPQVLLDQYYECVVSAYRFRLLQRFRRTSPLSKGVSLSYVTIREGWRDQLNKGAGLDIINIEKSYMPLYTRLGYVLCEGYDYLDPILGTPSCIMYLPVDPSRKSVISDIISDGNTIVCVDEVQKVLNRKIFAVSY